jgi:hypothetical protein
MSQLLFIAQKRQQSMIIVSLGQLGINQLMVLFDNGELGIGTC